MWISGRGALCAAALTTGMYAIPMDAPTPNAAGIYGPRVALGLSFALLPDCNRIVEDHRATGVCVISVAPGGAAARSGILVGDLVTTLNSRPIRNARDIAVVLSRVGPGTTIKAEVQRSGGTTSLTVAFNDSDGRTPARATAHPIPMRHEFDNGTGVPPSTLRNNQVSNLVLLGRVWGLLKYHLPAIANGTIAWDTELLHEINAALTLDHRRFRDYELPRWVEQFGVTKCSPCNMSINQRSLKWKLSSEWTADRDVVGTPLSKMLPRIASTDPHEGTGYYVQQDTYSHNALFTNEIPYSSLKLPDVGFQLLALFRLWNAVEYWYPYRDLLGRQWRDNLPDFVRAMAAASDELAFQKVLQHVLVAMNDGHAQLQGSQENLQLDGDCSLPIRLQYIKGKWIVIGVTHTDSAQLGDELEKIDGRPIEQRAQELADWYPGSNTWSTYKDVANALVKGKCEKASIVVRRNGRALATSSTRTLRVPEVSTYTSHPAIERYEDSITYVNPALLTQEDFFALLDSETPDALILDLRTYPQWFVGPALASRIIRAPRVFAHFASIDPSSPGVIFWDQPQLLSPDGKQYHGLVFVLVSEETKSSSEYSTLALQATGRAWTVGSHTAGADGNISSLDLPSGLSAIFSGLGVFDSQRRATQRAGIHVDIPVNVVRQDVVSGRDPALAMAIQVAKKELNR